MSTYLTLLISSLLAVLGVFLKTTTENTRKSNENIKKLTSAGWIILVLMTTSFLFSVVAQYHKERESKLIQKLAGYKDSMNATKIQQLLEKTTSDSLNKEKQTANLLSLLSSAKEINKAQTLALRQTDKYNNYLIRQIEEQRFQTERMLNPLEKLQLEYVLQIPGSQAQVQAYKKRILANDPCTTCDVLTFTDRDWLPDQKLPGENTFAWFLMDIFTSISFQKSSTQDFDFRPDFLMKSSASTSIERIAESKTDSSGDDKLNPRIILNYVEKDASFYIEIKDPNPFQRHGVNMLSFKDFPGKEVLLEVAIGVSIQSQLTKEYISMLRSIDFKIFEAVLHSENNVRKIKILNFKQVRNTGETRLFESSFLGHSPHPLTSNRPAIA